MTVPPAYEHADAHPRTAELFTRYAGAFATRRVADIVALHAADGRFWVHTGRAPAHGRPAIAAAFTELFGQWPELGFVTKRVILGPTHWVLDWDLTAVVGGRRVRFSCLDVVDVDADGLVTNKETFVDLVEARALPPAPAAAAAS